MPWFTSKRERWLWGWALATLAAIYTSAIFAGALIDALGSEVLLGIAFAAGLVLSCAAVVGMALTGRVWGEVWVTVAVVVVFAMIPVRSGVSAVERSHLFEYGLFAVLLYEALVERKNNGTDIRLPGLVAILTSASFGWMDEAVQAFVPTRVYDLRDVAVNALAGLVAVGAFGALRWGRRRVAGAAARRSRDGQPREMKTVPEWDLQCTLTSLSWCDVG